MRLTKRDSEGRKKGKKRGNGEVERNVRFILCLVTKSFRTRDTNNTYKSVLKKTIARKCKRVSPVFRVKIRRNSRKAKEWKKWKIKEERERER